MTFQSWRSLCKAFDSVHISLTVLISYLIFVNFGTPPHYLGLIKVHQKVRKFTKIGPNWPNFCDVYAKKHTSLKKKYTTAGCGGFD